MVTTAGTTTDVGRGPGTSIRQDQSGQTQFEEQREDGTHKLTTVLPDGSIDRTIELTPSSTGIKTTIQRFADGRVEQSAEGPGGEIQSTTRYPDGSSTSYRDFTAPDGTHWNHAIDKDGRDQTTHDIVGPDGTLHHHVRTFDGVMETTTTKNMTAEDGSPMTRINMPNGDIIERINRLDGTYELSTVHADGRMEIVGTSREADGRLVTRSVAPDGAETVDTSWTSPDGHEHRTIVAPDGSTKAYENWEDKLADGTSVIHHTGPNGTEKNTIHPDGSTEVIKEHSDGTTSTFTRTKNGDGSIDERQVRSDGSTSDSHYERNSDGGYTTQVRNSDGSEKTTLVGRDGRVEVHTVNPDGSRIDASFSSDGSGRTDVLDAQGHIDRSFPTNPDPRPVPEGSFTPETFLSAAQQALGPEILPGPPDIGQPANFGATALSEEQAAFLSQQGALPSALTPPPEDPHAQAAQQVPGATAQTPAAGAGEQQIGAQPAAHLVQDNGVTFLIERQLDGTFKQSTVNADGSVFNRSERTDSSTGITTVVEREPNGDVKTTIDSPGGTRQVTTVHPDGSQETFRAFRDPDGSQWGQLITPEGTQTTHMTFDPDGTLRQTVKTPGGTTSVTTTKTTEQPDGSSVTVVHAPNGDVSTMTARANGTSEMRLVHPDGTDVVSTSTTMPDGSKVTTLREEDGSVTTSTKLTTADGHDHETIIKPDGTTEHYETFGAVRPDGSSYTTTIGPTGSETAQYEPDGSIDRMKTNADGTTESYELIKNKDGSSVERETRADGATRETHYDKNLDGSYSTVKRDFDGTETRTSMDQSGRVSIRELNPDGTSVETTYGADGSGRTITLDAAGNQTGETAIAAVPLPVPRDFEPDGFLAQAQQQLPPEAIHPTTAAPEAGSHTVTDAELADISARGIVPPDMAADLDHATAEFDMVGGAVGVTMFNEDADLMMPPGALGDPTTLTNAVPTAGAGPLEHIPSNPDTVGLEFETEGGPDSIAVDGPQENIILPEPYPEEQIYPGEEQIEGMEPAVEYDPIGPDPDAEPLDTIPDPTVDP